MSPSCLLTLLSVSHHHHHHHKKTTNKKKKEADDADPVVMWWSTEKGDWKLAICPSPPSSSSSSSSSSATAATAWLLHRRTKRRIPLPELKEQHEIPAMAAKLSVKQVTHGGDAAHTECIVTLSTPTGRPPSLWLCSVVVVGCKKEGCKVCARGGGSNGGGGAGGWSHFTYGGGRRGWKEYGAAGSRATTSSDAVFLRISTRMD